jgi:hypothetical protein
MKEKEEKEKMRAPWIFHVDPIFDKDCIIKS